MVVLISTLQINILSIKSCILIIQIFSKVTFILTKWYFFENNYNSSETITTTRIKYWEYPTRLKFLCTFSYFNLLTPFLTQQIENISV